MPTLSEDTKIRLNLKMAAGILAGVLTFAGTVYGLRDPVMADIDQKIEKSQMEMKQSRQDELRGYMTRQEFLQWQLSESHHRDEQYYNLMAEIRVLQKAQADK